MAGKYYTVSTRLGDAWGKLRLGDFYAKGIEVAKDMDMAVQLYKASAVQGNKLAELRLAELYETGTVVEQNARFARIYYTRSVLQGYAVAEMALATFLERGVYQNPVEAYVWMSMAAKHKAAGAAVQLAMMRRQMTVADLKLAELDLQNMPQFVQQLVKEAD
jgi:TPR repeat protein